MVRGGRYGGNDLRCMGDPALSLQIAKLILYSRQGDVRELPFRLGGLNVLTGASKTGKSAIIDIVDYCTGRGECNVADGVIRKYVGWYAILFQLG
jgi:phage/plasmid-associated DNA primase